MHNKFGLDHSAVNSVRQWFQPFQSNAILIYCLQICIVLSGTTLGLYFLGLHQLIVPVTLGAIATALTDFDDRLSIRLRNLAYVCILFFSVSSILDFLHPYKFLFILYLSLSSACFILMGALGQRYAAISFGTILLSIYTMFGLGEYAQWYFQPSCFVLGALWYGLTAILFYLIKPTLAVQDNLSRCFDQIADLLNAKAQLFDPDNQDNVEALLYGLSIQNSAVVQSLNSTKSSLLTRLKASRANSSTIYWLNLYFLAQDIHEQASSNYLHYEQLHQNFSRTDLIFRIQKNIRLQALACHELAQCILRNDIYQPSAKASLALSHLHSSMQDWVRDNPHNIEVKNLQLILNNLDSVHERFLHLNELQNRQQQRYQQHIDNLNLYDDDIHGWHDLWLKLKQHLTPQSALFRHAVRIAFVFAVGYSISLLPFAQNGYWILLTSLFVCQISYFATKSRLKMRTLGTLSGVLCGIPILYFVPSVEGQLLLTVICGVLFFYLRVKKYSMATLMATLMVLLIFNIKGAGYEIILPRIIDTLLGCAIAWLAVSFIWPDWKFRNLPRVLDQAINANCRYLDAILEQYHQGRDNRLAYRVARRDAHSRDGELASVVSNLSTEPRANSAMRETAFRLLCLNHTFTSYISTLGAHREKLTNPAVLNLLDDAVCYVDDALHHRPADEPRVRQALDELAQRIAHLDPGNDSKAPLVLQQIGLLIALLPEICRLQQQIATWRSDSPVAQAAH